jgi:hypothetical protein
MPPAYKAAITRHDLRAGGAQKRHGPELLGHNIMLPPVSDSDSEVKMGHEGGRRP